MITDITEKELAALTIERAIIHDIPKKLSGSKAKPELGGGELSEMASQLDGDAALIVCRKIVQTLGGKHAFDLVFREETESPVPGIVRKHTSSLQRTDSFIDNSRRLAKYLYESQDASNSAGLLCILDCKVTDMQAFCILKVERESGLGVNTAKRKGKRTIELSVVRDLILTTSKRVFKNVLFLRTSEGSFLIRACDIQQTDIEIAQFWRNFLGCDFKVVGRILTKRFYELNQEYIDKFVSDPTEKAAWWQSTLSELSSRKKAIDPNEYIESYVPPPHQPRFEKFLTEHDFPLKPFRLDTSVIVSHLRRIMYRGVKGSIVSVPADKKELIKIESERIVVADSVETVG